MPPSLNSLYIEPKAPFELKKPWPEGGYLQKFPRDAYGNHFIYRPKGTGGEPFDLISYGADLVVGGEGIYGDLWNHDKRPPAEPDEKKK